MTPLQTRFHNEVCLPSGLTACLCGAYARVGQAFADEQVERSDNHGMCVAAKDYDDQVKHTDLVRSEYQKRLDAAREMETRLREEWTRRAQYYEGKRTAYRDKEVWWRARRTEAEEVLAALSAGAGEK